MAATKVYSIQPRFKQGDALAGWSIVDGIFQLGQGAPPYGSTDRDTWMSAAWVNEPMTAGVFSTWVERVQTLNWKITGGRNNARAYSQLFNDSDNGAGYSYHVGCCAIDYLTCDKGSMEELGRQSKVSTSGKVMGIQHLDATRMVRVGLPEYRWRFFPELASPMPIPDDNLIQIVSLPSGRDRWRGLGYCAMSRLLDAKSLMLGYLTYYRQEIGDLPPELVVIINGLAATQVQDSLAKYKADKQAAGLKEYGKMWWLGSDDPSTPVTIDTRPLTTPTKSFNYNTMVEWWAKMLALNTGEDVGEYWLIQQTGATKAVQSIQAMKARGKGVARFISEQERRYNADILPYGVTFEYDNKDDDQDKAEAEILGARIGNLKALLAVGQEQQSFPFTAQEVRQLAVDWDIVQPSEESPVQVGESNPTGGPQPAEEGGVPAGAFGEEATPELAQAAETLKYLGGLLQRIGNEDLWAVDMHGMERRVKSMGTTPKVRDAANSVYQMLQQVYFGQHMQMADVLL